MENQIEKKEENILIKFENLTKRFGDFTAVSKVSLEIYKGEILGFLGPNGAGKSTTMKMMARLLKPNDGSVFVRVNGDLIKMNTRNKDYLLNNIGFLIENPAFYDDVTPREILRYFALLKGYPKKHVNKRVEEVVKLVGLSDWIDKKMGTFSKGMRQKIGIISAIVHDPDIIVFDEPHTGLDPKARKEVRDLILFLKKRGKTIFLSSHLLYEISEVADRVAIIFNGKIIACDTLDRLEAIIKKSVIHVELLNKPKGTMDSFLTKISEIVEPITGLNNEKNDIRFNDETGIIEILFDGNSENQAKILRKLLENGIDVLEFSVPKAGLLESLYLDLINKEEVNIKNQNKKQMMEAA